MKKILFYFLALCAGMLIFLGLPLAGWGLGKLPQFFENPVRFTYAIVIFCLQVFSVWYNPQVGQNKDDRKSGVERRRLDLLLIQVFSLAVVVLAPFSDGHAIGIFNFGNAIRWVGLVLMTPGFILMQAAEKHLARQFSVEVTLQKNHILIQTGPYAYIRHPRYLGILIFFTGISLVFRSMLALLVVLALTGVLIWRVYAEEDLLHQEFGENWEAYRKKSWRILPFVF